VRRVEDEIPRLARFAGTIGASARQMSDALKAREAAEVVARRVVLYASMLHDGDQINQDNQARLDNARALSSRLAAATAFFEPELLAVAPATVEQYLREEQDLAPYRHYLDKLGLLRGHIRTPDVEEVLALAADVTRSPANIHGALENADLTFGTITGEDGQEVVLTQGNSGTLIGSAVRAVRRAAWQAYADGYLAVKNAMAGTLAGGVKRDVFYARARRYSSAREASMQPHNLQAAVFDNLIATVRAHLPLWHRYWAIRRRALGVAALHPYDIDVPLATAEETIDYDRGVELLLAALAPLGEEYVAVARRGLTDERWVDRYANLGKGSGAHSTGAHGTRPFLTLNYDNTLLSLGILAHELGHSMHSYFSWQNQPPIYATYSMFVAETASNFNQALLRAHLLKEDPRGSAPSRRFQVAVIEEGMANFYRYFFIMPILAQFELDAHERVERGEALTADGMSAKIVELYGEGYGDKVVIDPPRVGITWAQFPHLFGNFYVWQYATGISAANALASGVLAGGKPAAERYLDFLKAGDAVYPLDALRLAGIDMATPAPIERAFGVLEELVDRLDELVEDGPLPWLRETSDEL
jgi:oligoendopeptidase F